MTNHHRLASSTLALLVLLSAFGCTRRPPEAPSAPDVPPSIAATPTPPAVPLRGIEVPPGLDHGASSPVFPPTDAMVVREQVIRANVDMGAGDQTAGPGQIDANAVARIIRGQLGGLRACYERELRTVPTLAGRIEMTFTIGATGRTTSVSAGGPLAATAPAVASCVSSRLRGLVFPVPEGGTVDFTFPFTLTPGG